MNWQVISVCITAVLATVAFNAWCMKLVIDNAVAKNMLIIMEKFVLKEDFDKHVEQCPARK